MNTEKEELYLKVKIDDDDTENEIKNVPEEIVDDLNVNEPMVDDDEFENKDITHKEMSNEEKMKKEKENTLYFEKLTQLYYHSTTHVKDVHKKNEFEVRFGTGSNLGKFSKPLSKTDYDNVIKKMKSLGFTSMNENGDYSLRIQNEFLDRRSGRFKVSNIRTEINGFHLIQEYCRTNNISEIIKKASHSVKFTKKEPVFISSKKRRKRRKRRKWYSSKTCLFQRFQFSCFLSNRRRNVWFNRSEPFHY